MLLPFTCNVMGHLIGLGLGSGLGFAFGFGFGFGLGLAAVEDELGVRLEEGGQLLPREREAPLPVRAVEVAAQLLLLQRRVGEHHELAVRVVAHPAVHPRLQHLGCRVGLG